jgi:hypothetical protein
MNGEYSLGTNAFRIERIQERTGNGDFYDLGQYRPTSKTSLLHQIVCAKENGESAPFAVIDVSE